MGAVAPGDEVAMYADRGPVGPTGGQGPVGATGAPAYGPTGPAGPPLPAHVHTNLHADVLTAQQPTRNGTWYACVPTNDTPPSLHHGIWRVTAKGQLMRHLPDGTVLVGSPSDAKFVCLV